MGGIVSSSFLAAYRTNTTSVTSLPVQSPTQTHHTPFTNRGKTIAFEFSAILTVRCSLRQRKNYPKKVSDKNNEVYTAVFGAMLHHINGRS